MSDEDRPPSTDNEEWSRKARQLEDRLRLVAADLARERFARRTIDQALLDAIAERDRLRVVCDAVGAESIVAIVAERDRLRAVVSAYHTGLSMIISVTDIEIAHNYAQAALDANPTGEDT